MKIIKEGMTVNQLIKQLEKYKGNDKVYILDHLEPEAKFLKLIKVTKVVKGETGEVSIILLPPDSNEKTQEG